MVGHDVFYVLPKPHWDDIVSDHPHPQPPSYNGGSDTPRHLERVARLGGEDPRVMYGP